MSNSDLSASRIWIIDDGSFIYKYNPIPCPPPVPPFPSELLSLLPLSIPPKELFSEHQKLKTSFRDALMNSALTKTNIGLLGNVS